MKIKFVIILSLIIILGTFSGCELAPSLPEILTTVKGYNNEIIALIIHQVGGSTPESFTVDAITTLDNGISIRVDSSSASELELFINLDKWVASDGTEIDGIVQLDFSYYPSPAYISIIETDTAMLHFNRTSAGFEAEVFDGDPATEAFTYAFETFFSTSLSVDGTPLIASPMRW